MASTTALGVIAALGALAHAAATVKWYEPVGSVPSPPVPVLEAVIFGVSFGAMYFGLGLALRGLATVRPPYSGYLLIVISIAGFAIAVAVATGRFGSSRRLVERVMSALLAGMLWLLPLLVLIL